MKTKLSTILLATSILFFAGHNSVQAQKMDGGTLVKEFYMAYIGQYGIADQQAVKKNLMIIRKKYCTPKLFAKVNKIDEAHNDPFTDAKSGDIKSLGTLAVTKDPAGQNKYIASYIYPGDKSKKTIRLSVVKDNKIGYKISSVGNL